MRNYKGGDPHAISDYHTRELAIEVDRFCREVSTAIGSIGRGEAPNGAQTVIGVSDHGGLSGLLDDDHSQYLLLAGRGGQTVTDGITINNGASNTALTTIGGLVAKRFAAGTNIQLMDSVDATNNLDLVLNNSTLNIKHSGSFAAVQMSTLDGTTGVFSGNSGVAHTLALTCPSSASVFTLLCTNSSGTTFIHRDGSLVVGGAGQVVRVPKDGAFQFVDNAGTSFVSALTKDTSDRLIVGETNISTIYEKPGGTVRGTWDSSGLTLQTALAITSGGTGATTAAGARTNLGLGTLATANSVDSNSIDNRTRSFFIPCTAFFDSDSGVMVAPLTGDGTTYPTAYYMVELPDASSIPQLTTMFQIPYDYSSGITWKLAFAAGPSGPTKNIVIDYYAKTVSAGTAAGMAGSNDISSTVNVVAIAGVEHTLNYSTLTTSTGIVPNGFVRFQFRRSGSNGSDNYTDSVFFLGLLVEYTADS